MPMIIEDAVKSKALLRLALIGTAGSGKSKSSLLLASGLGGSEARIGVIDTERRSSSFYAKQFKFKVIHLTPPYTVAKYREAITTFEDAGFDIIIVDSLSHAWAGEGGLLDKQGQLEASGRYKNSFSTWRDITPEHNKLVDQILQSPCHIIVTMRVKTEYVMEEQTRNGRMVTVPKKVGLSPIQRDGLEFEMSVVMDIDELHFARATKDRTDLFNGWRDQITAKTGEMLRKWLDDGEEAPEMPPPPNPDDEAVEKLKGLLQRAETLKELDKIANYPSAVRLADRISDDYEAALKRVIDWTTGSEEAAD